MAPTIRRVKDVDVLLRILEPHEPDSTLLVAPLQERGLGRYDQGWLVEEDGAPLGVLVVSRVCRDRWQAFVYLLAGEAAPLIARQVERTASMAVGGLEEHVSHVAAHLTRVKEMHVMPYFGSPARHDDEANDYYRYLLETTPARVATRDDLDDLVELFATYELGYIPTIPRLRQVLRECFDLGRAITVVEREGQLIAAMRVECQSKRFAHMSSQTVLPAHRGEGLSGHLGGLLAYVLNESEIGTFAIKNTYNPVPLKHEVHLGDFRRPIDPEHLEEDGLFLGSWGVALVQRRYKIPGAGRIRKLIERIEGPIRPRHVPAQSRRNVRLSRSRVSR